MFLVAGGYEPYHFISSTETLVEGGIAWNFEQNLPYPNGLNAMASISLPDTVILLGKFLKPLNVNLILVGLVKNCCLLFNVRH